MTIRIPRSRTAVITAGIAGLLLVLGGTAVAAYAAGHDDGANAATAAIDHRIECSAIQREYNAWHRRWPELSNLLSEDPTTATVQIEALVRDARELDRTAAGFEAGAAQTFAVQALAFRATVEDVNLRGMTTLLMSQDDYQRIRTSWTATEAAYDRYAATHCH